MTDPARRIQSLEHENANLHELARAAENYCWTVLENNISHRTDAQAASDLCDAVANYRHDHLRGARHDD